MSRPWPRPVPYRNAVWPIEDRMTTDDDETEAANRMQAAFEAVHEAVLRLLREGAHDPQYLALALALARATGELGADIAQAGGMEGEELLDDLAELVRLAGEEPPVAGSA